MEGNGTLPKLGEAYAKPGSDRWQVTCTALPMDGDGQPLTKKIAIVAKAPSTRDMAPFDDASWEIWGLGDQAMPTYPNPLPKWDRWFEIHDLDSGFKRWRSDYVEWLKQDHGKPLYINAPNAEVKSAVVYPRREVFGQFDQFMQNVEGEPVHYYTNSVAWMLALAIHEGATEIAVFGVDMAQHGVGLKSEYAHQRPSVELWLGIAAGRGIKVTIPKESDLCKTPHLYGYDSETNALKILWKARKGDVDKSRKAALEQASKAQFEIDRQKFYLKHFRDMLASYVGTDPETVKRREECLERCAQFSAAIKNQRKALEAAVQRQFVIAGADEDMQYFHQHVF